MCDIWGKNLASFCPCPENQSEAELKDYILACLTEGMLGQGSVRDGAEKAAEVVKEIMYNKKINFF